MQNAAVRTVAEAEPCELIHSGTQLSVLPAAVPELLAVLGDEEISFPELAKKIAEFPTVAARLMFLANSSWAAPVAEITSLEMACAKLGLALVKSVSISLAIAAPFDPGKCPAFRSDRFWSTALLVAEGAAALARRSDQFGEEALGSVHTAALLHNLGLLWLADNMPEAANGAFEQTNENPELSLAEVLRAHCGADHARIGGCLAQAWEFPAMIESAMQNHLDADYAGAHWQIALVTGLAAAMAHCLDHQLEYRLEDPRVARLGIEPAEAVEVFEHLEQRHERVREMVRVLFC